jgi:hypothetical protein
MCDRTGREPFSDIKDNNIKIYLPEMREFVLRARRREILTLI